jgi:hypothetical protein
MLLAIIVLSHTAPYRTPPGATHDKKALKGMGWWVAVGLIPTGGTGDSGAGIAKDGWRQTLSGPVPNGVNGGARLCAKVFVVGAGCW